MRLRLDSACVLLPMVLCTLPAHGQEPGMPIAPLMLVAPPDEAVFTNFPRTIHFRWRAVPAAASYALEIDCMDCCVQGQWCSEAQGTGFIVADLKQPEYTFDFWGNQKGRWRVWAVDAQSQPGYKSAWSRFSFTTSGQPATQPRVPDRVPPAPSSPGAPSSEPVYSVGGGVTMPHVVYSPQPGYTDSARKAKISGDVMLDVIVGSDGAVREAHVIRSLDPGLDSKALEAVQQWRFQPALRDGKPVTVRAQISMSFRLL